VPKGKIAAPPTTSSTNSSLARRQKRAYGGQQFGQSLKVGVNFLAFNFGVTFLSYLELLNHHLFQKLKLIGRGKFNYLINTLTLSLTCGLILSLNKGQKFKIDMRPLTCEKHLLF
jgi:hypothetical protein